MTSMMMLLSLPLLSSLIPAFAGIHTVLAVLLPFSFMLLLAFLLLGAAMILLSSLQLLVAGATVVACVTAVACIQRVAGILAVSGVLLVPDGLQLKVKGLVAGCHSFCLFSYFLLTYIHTFIQSHSHNTFIRRHSLGPLSISSSLESSVGRTSLWCRAENRTRVTVASLLAISGDPGVASISAVPFKLVVAGGPVVIGFPAVDGVLVVACISADPGDPFLAGGFTYWTVQ